MENTHTEEKNVAEKVIDNDLLPIVIEKQPHKKQEKQRKAQLGVNAWQRNVNSNMNNV